MCDKDIGWKFELVKNKEKGLEIVKEGTFVCVNGEKKDYLKHRCRNRT